MGRLRVPIYFLRGSYHGREAMTDFLPQYMYFVNHFDKKIECYERIQELEYVYHEEISEDCTQFWSRLKGANIASEVEFIDEADTATD